MITGQVFPADLSDEDTWGQAMDDRLSPDLPQDGVLDTGAETLARAASDFGGIVSDQPAAVLHARSAADIQAALRVAAGQRMPVVARGRGHSSLGQAQVRDGIVLDVAGLDRVHRADGDHVVVEAGATWAEVLRATLEHGRTPPVLTDYLGVSVGGTLSVGGIGGTSHRHGVQTDNVLALEVITGDGVHRSCSPAESPDLFQAALAGYGRCGVIVRATLPLLPAPARVRRFKIYYPTAGQLLSRQRRLLQEGRFDFLQGQILPTEAGWTFMLDVGQYYTPPAGPGDGTLLDGLGYEPTRDETDDLSYWDFANRLADTETYLRQTGDWFAPHPWLNLLLPGQETDGYLAGLMTGLDNADVGDPGLVLVYPVFGRALRTPLFRAPESDVVFLVAVLRFAPAGDTATVGRMLAGNRELYERAMAVGGTAYPSGAVPFSDTDWTRHLGRAQAGLRAAVERYDPQGVFCPGLTRTFA